MKVNEYEQENYELRNVENTSINIKVSFWRKIVIIISKILAVGWTVFIGYCVFEWGRNNIGESFKIGTFLGLIFPAIIYLILSSRLYKNFKEKHPKLNIIKMMIVSLGISIIINIIVNGILNGNINGIVNILIISIPEIFIIWVIDIVLSLRKRKLKKYLEKDSYEETKCDYESNEVSSVEKISTSCNRCGYENKVSAKFCNQCGLKIEETHNKVNYNKFESDKLSKKKKILISMLSVVILIGCIMIWNSYKDYQYETGYNLSYEDKKINLEVELITGSYDKAKKLSNAYKIHTDDIDKIIQIYKERKDGKNNFASLSDVENYLSKQNCIVTDLYSTSISSSYRQVHITVKNNSKRDINYVKVNLYFYDSDGKIVKSDWTNDSSCIKPGATQQLDKMVNKGWYTFKAEVAEYN